MKRPDGEAYAGEADSTLSERGLGYACAVRIDSEWLGSLTGIAAPSNHCSEDARQRDLLLCRLGQGVSGVASERMRNESQSLAIRVSVSIVSELV